MRSLGNALDFPRYSQFHSVIFVYYMHVASWDQDVNLRKFGNKAVKIFYSVASLKKIIIGR